MNRILDRYDTVIFDMDGVITSEQNYWNCAALTVWEYMHNREIDVNECMNNIPGIRSHVFLNDELIGILKSKGVNSNWDLGYLTVLIAWICGGKDNTEDFSGVLEYAKALPDNIIEVYSAIAKRCSAVTGYDYSWLCRNDTMWQTMQRIFQTWFLGDELFMKSYGVPPIKSGKRGLLYSEEPIVDKTKLITLLNELGKSKRLCTGTGRPYVEMIQPLTDWGVKECFATDGLICYDHVSEAEKKLNNNALTKPHPYMFLKALYGEDYDDALIISGDYDKSKIERTLVVGDAGADILAAHSMGADFCAVLTGINGIKSRAYFEELGAEYILNSVLDLA